VQGAAHITSLHCNIPAAASYTSQVVLTNVPEQHSSTVQGATLPGRPESSSYDLPFSRVVYIEATDFRLQDSKDYYGLAPGKSAMLRCACACAAKVDMFVVL
jgi:hypothetical protein